MVVLENNDDAELSPHPAFGFEIFFGGKYELSSEAVSVFYVQLQLH